MAKAFADLKKALGKSEDAPVAEPKVTVFKDKAEKFKALEVVAKTLNKQFNTTNSIQRLGAQLGFRMPSISTGLISVDDDVIGTGGVPRGRIIEIFGPESAGKTTISLHIIAQEQKNTGNLCAFVDAEHALDVNYAKFLGVNVDELLVSQPDSGEQALETVEALIDSKAVSLIVVDSAAALVPQAELDGDMGDANMGLQARLLSQAMRKLRGKANTNGVTVIFINQLREKIGVMFGNPETTTGGRALKFYSSVRLDIRRRAAIKTGDLVTGHEIEIKAVKNKVGVPFRQTTITLDYSFGIDHIKDLIQYAEKVKVLNKAGAWYRFGEENIGNGLTNTVQYVSMNPELIKKIKEGIEKAREPNTEITD